MSKKLEWGILLHKRNSRDAVWDGWYLDKKDAKAIAEYWKKLHPNAKVLLIKYVLEVNNDPST
jgi:hypothetical protein